MTIKDGVDALNRAIPEDMDAKVVLLTGLEKERLSEEELAQLDALRGDKLNLVHKSSWHPETITHEDAELIRRGLDVYRHVLWEVNGDNIMASLKEIIAGLGDGDEE